MQKAGLFILIIVAVVIGCAGTEPQKAEYVTQPMTGEAEIEQSLNGDFPVNKVKILQEKTPGTGSITDAKTFKAVWKAFKPGEDEPKIDFNSQMVLFVRNTQFYNRVSINKVMVKKGVAELLAMETMSAIPIEDKVAISMVVVPRDGILSIRTADGGAALGNKSVILFSAEAHGK